jgi:hypothetical protein
VELVPEQGRAGGEQHGGADALKPAAHDEHVDRARQPAGQRGPGEDREPGEEETFASAQIAERAGGHQERGQRQRVAVDHPLQTGEGRVQRGLDLRQGHGDDAQVEHQHERGQTDDGQRPAAG